MIFYRNKKTKEKCEEMGVANGYNLLRVSKLSINLDIGEK